MQSQTIKSGNTWVHYGGPTFVFVRYNERRPINGTPYLIIPSPNANFSSFGIITIEKIINSIDVLVSWPNYNTISLVRFSNYQVSFLDLTPNQSDVFPQIERVLPKYLLQKIKHLTSLSSFLRTSNFFFLITLSQWFVPNINCILYRQLLYSETFLNFFHAYPRRQ